MIMYLFIFESRHMSFELFIFPFFFWGGRGGGLVVGEIKYIRILKYLQLFQQEILIITEVM